MINLKRYLAWQRWARSTVLPTPDIQPEIYGTLFHTCFVPPVLPTP